MAGLAFAALLAGAHPVWSQTRAEPDEVRATADTGPQSTQAPEQEEPKPSPFPLLAQAARERGIELPLPFGVGLVY
jgi:hypothetical protein